MAPQYRSNEHILFTLKLWKQRLTEGNIARIWSVRNFKTVFREIETERRKEDINKKAGTVISSTVLYTSQISTPRTPQNRTYVGLDKIATSRNKNKDITEDKSIDEDEVVDLIKKWRVGEEEESELDEVKKAEIALMNSLIEDDATYSLKRDNIAPDEDVEKVKELGEIFKRTSNDMNGKQLQLKRKKQVKEAKQK
ncbi:uncharacterized protein OCT59_024204 [Rhizophagus irregularis]|uniref:uncharacterized protein n=1 Tax=Rhizophagus irregularis TaxID=588596 RepID=UPI001A05FE79|nr:hypothetical protein OCT59_024204 [Rhizophagus irregularis]GBC22405.2 hypothetical protein GLOIN_2v1839012 [Rhizophagus irregularis DAOM 181602=DAOM 197198]